MTNIKKSDIVNTPIMALYKEGYYFCMMYLFIRGFISEAGNISVLFTDENGLPHKARVYMPFEDTGYFTYNGHRVRISDCEYVYTNNNGLLQRTGCGVVLTDRPEYAGTNVTLVM